MNQGSGFVFGAAEDGTVYFKKSRHQYTIEIEQKNPLWLEAVQREITDVYGLHSRIYKTSKGYHRLVVMSKQLYNEILERRRDYRKILEESKSFQIGFLKGIFDAEGTVHKERNQIRIASKRQDVIETIRELLNILQIKTGKIHKDNAVYVLPFYGKENLKHFQIMINFRHPEKKSRLKNLTSN